MISIGSSLLALSFVLGILKKCRHIFSEKSLGKQDLESLAGEYTSESGHTIQVENESKEEKFQDFIKKYLNLYNLFLKDKSSPLIVENIPEKNFNSFDEFKKKVSAEDNFQIFKGLIADRNYICFVSSTQATSIIRLVLL